jgi:hypothetical protein
MSALSYKITFSAGAKLDLVAGINAQVLPLLNQAVRAVAQQTAIEWQKAVHHAKLWSGEKDAYAKSIKWEMTGDFSAMVDTDYKYASEIETGRGPRDLKKMLDTSLKVRRTAGGKRFLVIPMRDNTPGNGAHAKSMPQAVYGLASAMAPSRVVGKGQRPSGEVTMLSPKTGMHAAAKQSPYLSNPKTKQAATVVARKYAWGGRLTAGALKGAGMDAATVKRYAGMVRMDTSTPGGSKSSEFMRFRIMMEGSSGWVIPAKPGLFLARNVAQAMQPKAEAAFAAAVKKTISG